MEMEDECNCLTSFVVDLNYEDDTTIFYVPMGRPETEKEQFGPKFGPKFAMQNDIAPTPENLCKVFLPDPLINGIVPKRSYLPKSSVQLPVMIF